MRVGNFREHAEYYMNARFKTTAPKLLSDLEDEYKAVLDACTTLEGVDLHRAQGEAQFLKELISVLATNVPAPSIGDGISGVF